MTETRAPYWTHALDAHIRAQARPPAPVLAMRPLRASEERRRRAVQVLERCHAEIIRRLQLPPRGMIDGERRVVQLWDLLELSVAADGTDYRVEFLSEDRDISHCLVSPDLWSPIGPSRWMVVFEPVIVPVCREMCLDPRSLIGETGDFILFSMGNTFRKFVHWNRLRRTLLEFLAPDPLTYSLTRRIFDDGRPGLDCFNWVGHHLRELALVAIDRPRMLPFLQHVDRLSSGSPLENFRREVEDAGMSPSAFRKLECWGHGCFAAAMQAPLTDWKQVMVGMANLLDRLQVQGECPPILGQIATHDERRFPPDWFMRTALVEVRRLEEEDPEDCCPLDVEDALAWLASKLPQPDENQRRAGWDWISAQAWKYRLATDAEAARPWPVPHEERVIGDFRVVPIRSRVELREEGERMSNCLATWGDACASGRFAVFSIRDAAGKKRIASFSIEKAEASWRLLQIAGKVNAKVPEDLQLIAREVAALARLG